MPEHLGDFDKLGFMLKSQPWNRDVALALAENRDIGPLSEAHWKVINYVRDYYEQNQTAPMLRAIIKRTRIGERRLRELFPSTCRECMCLVAGLMVGVAILHLIHGQDARATSIHGLEAHATILK